MVLTAVSAKGLDNNGNVFDMQRLFLFEDESDAVAAIDEIRSETESDITRYYKGHEGLDVGRRGKIVEVLVKSLKYR